jgi:hypothetical protein
MQVHISQLQDDNKELLTDNVRLISDNERLTAANDELKAINIELMNKKKVIEVEPNEESKGKTEQTERTLLLPEGVHTNIFRCEPYTFAEGSQQAMLQEHCKTDPETGIRYYTDVNGTKWHCAALAGAFGKEIGSGYIFTLANGLKLPVILSDFKHPINYIRDDDYGDTDQNYLGENCVCVIEFVVDMNVIPNSVKQAGTMSALPQFVGLYSHEGNIVDVKKCERVWKP